MISSKTLILKSLSVFLLFALLSTSLGAQKNIGKARGKNDPMVENISNPKSLENSNPQKRMVTAKLLLELDKTEKANNRNNGRSNRDECCADGISPPSDYQVLAFGLTTSWYLRGELSGTDGIPNPLPYLQSMSSSWDVLLFDGNAKFLASKSAYVQDNELLLSIDGLAKGTYFLQIEHDGVYFATGFSIGNGGLPTSTSTPNNR